MYAAKEVWSALGLGLSARQAASIAAKPHCVGMERVAERAIPPHVIVDGLEGEAARRRWLRQALARPERQELRDVAHLASAMAHLHSKAGVHDQSIPTTNHYEVYTNKPLTAFTALPKL